MTLTHIALYTKHWYERSGNIWSDIFKCIQADGYTPIHCGLEDAVDKEDYEYAGRLLEQGKDNVITILTNEVTPIISNDKIYMMHKLMRAIDKHTCWEFGYFHSEFWAKSDCSQDEQDKMEPYNYKTAVLYFFLSQLHCANVSQLGWDKENPPKPDRSVLPIPKAVEEEMKAKIKI